MISSQIHITMANPDFPNLEIVFYLITSFVKLEKKIHNQT